MLRDNTAQTFVPAVVERAQLERANGALWSCEQLAGQFVGPPLAGFLIGVSVAVPFGVHARASGGGRRADRGDVAAPPPVASGHPPLMASLREGLGWLWRDVMLRRLALLLGGFNFIGYGFVGRVRPVWPAGSGAGCVRLRRVADAGGLRRAGRQRWSARRSCGGSGPTAAILTGMTGSRSPRASWRCRRRCWLVAAAMVAGRLCRHAVEHRAGQLSAAPHPAPLLGRVNSAFRFIGTGPAAFGAFAFGALIAWAAPLGTVNSVLLPYAAAALIGAALTVFAAVQLRLER